MFKEYLML